MNIVLTSENANDAIWQCIASLQQESDVSFFVAIRQIIQASGLEYSFIAGLATMNSANDPFYQVARRMHPSTVSNIARARDLPTYYTMRRLVIYGLGLDEEHCHWLEGLRRQEEYVHHTTNPQLVTTKVEAIKRKPSPQNASGVPEWIQPDER